MLEVILGFRLDLSATMPLYISQVLEERTPTPGGEIKNWEQFKHHIDFQKHSPLSYCQHMILGNGYAASLEIEFAA